MNREEIGGSINFRIPSREVHEIFRAGLSVIIALKGGILYSVSFTSQHHQHSYHIIRGIVHFSGIDRKVKVGVLDCQPVSAVGVGSMQIGN
jgi:hypothetical protein